MSEILTTSSIDLDKKFKEGKLAAEPIGYVGPYREAIVDMLDHKVGPDSWAFVWKMPDGNIISQREALTHYEESYRQFFINNVDVFDSLIKQASDVYYTGESNIFSGVNYETQETREAHWGDIAIRRCVIVHFQHIFGGSELLRVHSRSSSELGRLLSPGNVPFYQPELIQEERFGGWWHEGSIEDFWNSNRFLQLAEWSTLDPDELQIRVNILTRSE